jgi:hypothetical protein
MLKVVYLGLGWVWVRTDLSGYLEVVEMHT